MKTLPSIWGIEHISKKERLSGVATSNRKKCVYSPSQISKLNNSWCFFFWERRGGVVGGNKFFCFTSFHYLNSNRSASDRAVRTLPCEKQNFKIFFCQRIFSPSSSSLNGKRRAWKHTSHLSSYCLRTSEKCRITGQTWYSRNRSRWIFHFENHSIYVCQGNQCQILCLLPLEGLTIFRFYANLEKYQEV